MANSNRSFWIDPDGPSFDFLKKCLEESAERVREREEAERKRKLAEEEAKRVEAELRRKLAEEQERRRNEQEQRRREEEHRRRTEAEQQRRLAATEAALVRVSSEIQHLRTQNQHLEEKMTKRIEILPPAAGIPALPQPEAELPQLDLTLFEAQIREAASSLDLKKPEGWLDKWFGRPDHRIRKKTERAELLACLVAATKGIILEYQRAIEAVAAVQRAKYQLFIDRLEAILKIMEAQYRTELARRNVERQDAIEDAKARAEIARYHAEAREAGLRGYPAPPPPPPPPAPAAPPPVDQFTREKDEARRAKQQEADLHIQDTDIRADAAEKKVARARARAIEIFNNSELNTGETRERIYAVLDEFGFDTSILPEKIRDFLKTTDTTTEDYTNEVQ